MLMKNDEHTDHKGPSQYFDVANVKGQPETLHFNLQGEGSYKFLLTSVERLSPEEEKKLVPGIGEFTVHTKEGDRDDGVKCHLEGDFKDPAHGAIWWFTTKEHKKYSNLYDTKDCPDTVNGIALKCDGDKRPMCMVNVNGDPI